MAVREWLLMQDFDFYSDGNFKLLPKWVKYTNVIGDCVHMATFWCNNRAAFNGV